MVHVDALVIGAGPAGATAAINLAPIRRVAMVDRPAGIGPRIGESLPAAARRLFGDMGLLESFERQGHLPCYGRRSVWGSNAAVESDALRDLDGSGWQLDRRAFDGWLRDAAIARGAALITGGVLGVERVNAGWKVAVRTINGAETLTAAVLIDAGGRSSVAVNWIGAGRCIQDRLVCAWVHGRATESGRGVGLICVEAERDGWWYTAMVPRGGRVVAFHTDADLPAARSVRTAAGLLERAQRAPEIADILSGCEFGPVDHFGVVAAHSAAADSCAADAWFAAGDAALAFDPIASQGLFNALYTGLAAAAAADGWLSGDADAIQEYRRTIGTVRDAYRHNLASCYALERRWPESTFWQRRFKSFVEP